MKSTAILHLLLLLQSSLAWLHPTSYQSRWTSTKPSKESYHACGALNERTSRRQWLESFASTVATVAGVSLAPQSSQAATLVSTKAVCDPGVSVWRQGNRLVYILGTAHISSASAVLAGNLVKDIHPKGVFVELDPKRVRGSGILASRLEGDTQDGGVATSNSRVIVPNIQRISEGTMTNGAADVAGASSPNTSATSMSSLPTNSVPNPVMKAASQVVGNSIKGMYKKLDTAGFQAGEEFVVAIREGQKIGSDIILGDRDVEVTLRRVTEGLARTDLKALMNPDSELEQSLKELVPSTVSSNSRDDLDLSDAEFREEFSTFVETMKAKENVRKVMVQLERIAPALYQALVSERDAYMAAGLNGLDELETIVAVVGVAHVDGIERNLSLNGWKAVLPVCAA
jgi:TraB/PrgY/gumN family